MGKRILSFEVDADGTFAGTPTPDTTFNYGAGTATIASYIVQISDLASIAQAISELINQSTTDGTTFTTNTSTGGVVVTWRAVNETIGIGPLLPWQKNVAISWADAIVTGV